jgi:hypothetical protein
MSDFFKKIDWHRIFFVFFYVFIFCLLLRSSFNYLDPDLGWHLKVGEEISRSGAVPDLNRYNYVFTGSWVDHEWLSNFLVYEVYSRWGYLALSAAFAGLAVLVLILLNIEARRLFPKMAAGLLAGLETVGIIASLPHLGVRIQEIGLLFTVLLLIIISRYSKRPDWRILLFLPPLFYLWASLHASFLLGFGLAAVWLGIKIAEKFLWRFYPRLGRDGSAVLAGRDILVFAGGLILSFGVTLLTPYRFRLYSFLSGYRDNFYRAHLQEWLSQFSFPFTYWQLAYLAFVALSLFLYIYYARERHRAWPLNLWTLFLAIFFVFLSFQSRRHFPLMFVATLWFLLEVHSGLWPAPRTGGKSTLNLWIKIYLSICLLLVAVFQITQTKFTGDPFRSFCGDYPCGAVEFLKSRPEYDARRLFNHYAWGGYLIWVWPERRLFIDGRLPQIGLAGHTYLEEYYEFFRAGGDIAGKLRQYDIGLVLLPAQDKDLTARNWERIMFMIDDEDLIVRNHLRDYLKSAPDWETLYADEAAVIYGRRD